MGTHVFFKKDENNEPDSLYGRCDSLYKFAAKTNKTVKMNRVLLRDLSLGKDSDSLAGNEEETEEVNLLKVTRTYEEALNLFLPPGKAPPRKISPEEEQLSKEIIQNDATSSQSHEME